MKYTVIVRGPKSNVRVVLEGEIQCLLESSAIGKDGYGYHLEDEGVDFHEFMEELDKAQIYFVVEDEG